MNKNAPSTTAIIVALGSYCVLQELPQSVVYDPRMMPYLREMLRHAPQPYAFLARLCRMRSMRRIVEKTMNCIIPGMFAHYVARKRYIESCVRTAVAHGCEQFVVIGGGLDTLGLRLLQDVPALIGIELDHPATQALKTQALRTQTHALMFYSTDLTKQTVSDALAHTTYTPTKKTVFVSEGVLMYLTEGQVRATLENIRSCAPPQSQLIVTFMEQRPTGQIAFETSRNRFVHAWLRRQKEPFLWGIARQDAAHFFASCGWRLHALSDWEQLHRLIPSGHMHPPARGEHVAVLYTT